MDYFNGLSKLFCMQFKEINTSCQGDIIGIYLNTITSFGLKYCRRQDLSYFLPNNGIDFKTGLCCFPQFVFNGYFITEWIRIGA
jgi:hypothetical protein